MRIRRKDLIWDKVNREHIKKHNLTPRQAEQALLDENAVVGPAHSGRFALIGQCGKRRITLFLRSDGKKYYLATARDANSEERRIYEENIEL